MSQLAYIIQKTTENTTTLGEISLYKQKDSETIYAVRGHSEKVDLERCIIEFTIPTVEEIDSNMALAKSALNGGTLLCSVDDIYSCMLCQVAKHDEIIFDKLKKKGRRDILMLGLGGGYLATGLLKSSVFEFFRINNGVETRLTGVEYDPKIIRLAKQYSEVLQGEKMAVVIGDGVLFVYDYVKQNETFDYVIVDVFDKNNKNVVSSFVNEKIIAAYRNILNDAGQVLININPKDKQLCRHIGSIAVKYGFDVEEISDIFEFNELLILTKRSLI